MKKVVYLYTSVFLSGLLILLLFIADMSSQAFLLSFQIFSNLYGVCNKIYSDNVKTFVQNGKALENAPTANEFMGYLEQNGIKHIKIPVYSTGRWAA